MSELLPPRDPKMLLTEMSARIKIKDIQQLYKLRDRVAVKWYESGLVAILFVAALSFLVIIIQLIPKSQAIVRDFVVGSSVALIIIITAILEFLLRKFNAMRRLYEIQSKILEDHERELIKLRRAIEEAGGPIQDLKNEDPH
jgi:uncharacterized membrane protein YcjF (UPF0283 family)